MNFLRPCFFSIVVLCSLSIARAQFLVSTPTTADSQILNVGATALAFDYNDSSNTTSTTVNSVVFSGSTTDGVTGVTISTTGLTNDASNGFVPVNPLLQSTSLAYAMTGLKYNNATPGSFTLAGLTVGHSYELQVFAGTSGLGSIQSEVLDDGTYSATLSFNQGGTDNSYIIENFVADASSRVYSVTASAGGFTIFNGVNLRDVSAPEPGVTALLLSGAAGLVFVGFLRRRTIGA